MNKQSDTGIEWTDYTWNPVGGCAHGCTWQMPDGAVAQCYAKSVAEGVASASYPQGFEQHYWHPDRLDEPYQVKTPARIFLDSMSDLMGRWVPDEQVEQVLEVVERAHWHTFQLLTKNAPRLLKFADRFPSNLWVGVSMPPTSMFGRSLTLDQQERYVKRALDVMWDLPEHLVKWWSFEPLSFDVSNLVRWYFRLPFQWAVIGAASNGRSTYQPAPGWVHRLLIVLDEREIPVFFKGNLDYEPRREEFPEKLRAIQMRMF